MYGRSSGIRGAQALYGCLGSVALQRRLPEDDRWVIPHNLEMAMFSPATVNVLPFDPEHGADQTRQYVCKYGSKPEKYYFLETLKDGVKTFLKAS